MDAVPRTRLDSLYQLRDRIDREIEAELVKRSLPIKPQLSAVEVKVIEPTHAEIRAWARKHGIEVNPFGRVHTHVRQQYLEAMTAGGTA